MARTIKRIHVDMHAIRANIRGAKLPVITVQNRGKSIKGDHVKIHGPSEVIYGKPLSCGARCYVETREKVTINGEDIE